MKIIMKLSVFLFLVAAGSMLSESALANPRFLDAVRAGCVATKTYEDEAKCFRGGVDAIQYGYRLRAILTDMCVPTKTYESEALCYRAAIDVFPGRRRLQENKDFCVRTTRTYQDEVTCMRDFLSRRPRNIAKEDGPELLSAGEAAVIDLIKPDAGAVK